MTGWRPTSLVGRNGCQAVPNNWLQTNQALWDERVPIHLGSDYYDVDRFLAGQSALLDFESTELGDVMRRRLLHLQCHVGLDTLSWARRGAVVTGVDFSPAAIHTAQDLAKKTGVADARFIVADVYRAAEVLAGETFDIVYTGIGALCWLPELTQWASMIYTLLGTGGTLYLTEFHPVAEQLGDDGRTIERDYFGDGPKIRDMPGSYVDFSAPTKHNRGVSWQHGLGEVVSAIAGSGMHLEFLHEHATTVFAHYPVLECLGDHRYGFAEEQPRVPLMYSLLATKH